MQLPRFQVRTLMTATAMVAAVLGGWHWLAMRNKAEFCRGWAATFAARAERLRVEAANPNLSESEAREYREASEWHARWAGKYATVASHPWLPYPSAPLASSAEEPTGTDQPVRP
jgi:hypothetical protein